MIRPSLLVLCTLLVSICASRGDDQGFTPTQVSTSSEPALNLGGTGCPVRPWTEEQEAAREMKFKITFEEAYASPPVVTAFFTYMAIDRRDGANMRLQLNISDVTTTGFTLVIGTWCDSSLNNVAVTWQAIGMPEVYPTV